MDQEAWWSTGIGLFVRSSQTAVGHSIAPIRLPAPESKSPRTLGFPAFRVSNPSRQEACGRLEPELTMLCVLQPLQRPIQPSSKITGIDASKVAEQVLPSPCLRPVRDRRKPNRGSTKPTRSGAPARCTSCPPALQLTADDGAGFDLAASSIACQHELHRGSCCLTPS